MTFEQSTFAFKQCMFLHSATRKMARIGLVHEQGMNSAALLLRDPRMSIEDAARPHPEPLRSHRTFWWGSSAWPCDLAPSVCPCSQLGTARPDVATTRGARCGGRRAGSCFSCSFAPRRPRSAGLLQPSALYGRSVPSRSPSCHRHQSPTSPRISCLSCPRLLHGGCCVFCRPPCVHRRCVGDPGLADAPPRLSRAARVVLRCPGRVLAVAAAAAAADGRRFPRRAAQG